MLLGSFTLKHRTYKLKRKLWGPYKWSYKWVTRVATPIDESYNPTYNWLEKPSCTFSTCLERPLPKVGVMGLSAGVSPHGPSPLGTKLASKESWFKPAVSFDPMTYCIPCRKNVTCFSVSRKELKSKDMLKVLHNQRNSDQGFHVFVVSWLVFPILHSICPVLCFNGDAKGMFTFQAKSDIFQDGFCTHPVSFCFTASHCQKLRFSFGKTTWSIWCLVWTVTVRRKGCCTWPFFVTTRIHQAY